MLKIIRTQEILSSYSKLKPITHCCSDFAEWSGHKNDSNQLQFVWWNKGCIIRTALDLIKAGVQQHRDSSSKISSCAVTVQHATPKSLFIAWFIKNSLEAWLSISLKKKIGPSTQKNKSEKATNGVNPTYTRSKHKSDILSLVRVAKIYMAI